MTSLQLFLCTCLIWQAVVAKELVDPLPPSLVAKIGADISGGKIGLEVSGAAPKINWQPVWDKDKEVVEVRRKPDTIFDYTIAGKPKPWNTGSFIDRCASVDGQGLKNLLRQAKALLPAQRIAQIIKSASSDPQVQALRQLVGSPTYLATLKELKKSTEFINFQDYACSKLKLDFKYYEDFLHTLLNFGVIKPNDSSSQPSESPEFQGRPGIRGLLQDIRDLLPKQQLRDLFQRLMEKDETLALAVIRLKSREFREIFQNLRRNENYKLVRQMLIGVGMPLQEIKDLISLALGWYGDEFDRDNLDLLI